MADLTQAKDDWQQIESYKNFFNSAWHMTNSYKLFIIY